MKQNSKNASPHIHHITKNSHKKHGKARHKVIWCYTNSSLITFRSISIITLFYVMIITQSPAKLMTAYIFECAKSSNQKAPFFNAS